MRDGPDEEPLCGRCGLPFFNNEVAKKARGVKEPCHDIEVCVLRLKAAYEGRVEYTDRLQRSLDNAEWKLSKALDQVESLKTSHE